MQNRLRAECIPGGGLDAGQAEGWMHDGLRAGCRTGGGLDAEGAEGWMQSCMQNTLRAECRKG